MNRPDTYMLTYYNKKEQLKTRVIVNVIEIYTMPDRLNLKTQEGTVVSTLLVDIHKLERIHDTIELIH